MRVEKKSIHKFLLNKMFLKDDKWLTLSKLLNLWWVAASWLLSNKVCETVLRFENDDWDCCWW